MGSAESHSVLAQSYTGAGPCGFESRSRISLKCPVTPTGDIEAAEGKLADIDELQSGSSYTIHLTVTMPTSCASPEAGFQAPFPIVTLINGFQVILTPENRHDLQCLRAAN